MAQEHGIELDVEDFWHDSYTIYMWPPKWYQDARENVVIDYAGMAYDWPDCLTCLKDVVEG